MKKLAAIPIFLLLCFTCLGSTIQIYMANFVPGIAETNYFKIIPVGTNVLANGSVIARGLPIICYPDVSGFFSTNLVIGNYQITNQYVNLLFQSFNDSLTYNLQDVLLPGFNTFAATGIRKLTSGDGTVILSPANGVGVVDLSAPGGGGGPPGAFIKTLNGSGTNTGLLNPILTNGQNVGGFTAWSTINASNTVTVYNGGQAVFQADDFGQLFMNRPDGTPEISWLPNQVVLYRNGSEFMASTAAETDIYDQSNRIGISLISQSDGSTLLKLPLNTAGGFIYQLGGKSNYFSGDIFSPHFWGDGSGLTGLTESQIASLGTDLSQRVLTNDSRNLVLSSATNNLGTDVSATHFYGTLGGSTITNTGLTSADAVATDSNGKLIPATAISEAHVTGLTTDLSQRVLTNDSRNLVLGSGTNNLGTDVSATHFYGTLGGATITNTGLTSADAVATDSNGKLIQATAISEAHITGLTTDLSQRVLTNDSRNLVLASATNNLGMDVSASNFWGNVSHAVGFPVGGVASSPTITITTNGNQVTPALANPLIISEMDIGDFYGTNLTIGGAYYSTNAYPFVPGTALEMDKARQFLITNAAVNITGFTAVSNAEVSECILGISNSAAGTIPFTFPVCVTSGGGTLSSYTIPSATTIYATFTIWGGWTNVFIWGTANGSTLPGTNTTIAVTDQYKTNAYLATANSHYFSNSVGFVLMTADSMTWSNAKTGNYLVWTNGGLFASNVVTGAWSIRTNDSETFSNLQGAVTILTNLSLALTNRTAANTGSLLTSTNLQIVTGTTGSNQLNNAANTAPVTVLTNGGGWLANDVEFGGFVRGVAGGASYFNEVAYWQTNNFPLNPGAINLDWRAGYQFITTNANFTLNGFINASNTPVNQVWVSVSNSSASGITFTWGGAPIRMYGTNTATSGPIPAGKVWKGLFQLDPHGTNLISPLMQSN